MAVSAYKHLYNTKAWYRLRYAQLTRVPMCEFCAKRRKVQPAQVVDHIKAHRGDERLFYDPANLQSLCKPCHDSVKQQMEKSGIERGCDENGIPVDAAHHWRQA